MSTDSTIIGNDKVNYAGQEKGTVNISGIDINIIKVLGDQIAEQFLTKVTDEEMNVIFNYMKKEIWDKNYNDETILKFTSNDSWSSRRTEPPKIANYAKNALNDKMKENIQQYIDEYVNSDEYKQKSEAIFKEIIDYALEGYKKDMINMLRQRLALDPFSFDEKITTGTIQSMIDSSFNSYYRS